MVRLAILKSIQTNINSILSENDLDSEETLNRIIRIEALVAMILEMEPRHTQQEEK